MLLSDCSLVQELDNLDDVYEDLTETSQSALSEDDCMDLVVVPPIHEDTHQLPFPEVSVEWYKRQNISTKNASRENIQHPCYDGGAIQYIDRSRVDGTIKENIKESRQKMALTKDKHTKAHLSSVVKVGEFILANSLLRRRTHCMPMERALGKVYHLPNCTIYTVNISILCKFIFTVLLTWYTAHRAQMYCAC